jgi:hypothetical protein
MIRGLTPIEQRTSPDHAAQRLTDDQRAITRNYRANKARVTAVSAVSTNHTPLKQIRRKSPDAVDAVVAARIDVIAHIINGGDKTR